MDFTVLSSLPVRVQVADLVSSRYASGKRPESWDLRQAGEDIIRTSQGEVIRLHSDGQQSPPQVGWTLLISSGDQNHGYRWTLYGMTGQSATI